jgi:hypothetical protein
MGEREGRERVEWSGVEMESDVERIQRVFELVTHSL